MKQTKQDVVTSRHRQRKGGMPPPFFSPSISVFEEVEDASGQRRDPNPFTNFFDKRSLKNVNITTNELDCIALCLFWALISRSFQTSQNLKKIEFCTIFRLQ